MNRSFITWLGLILTGACGWFNYAIRADARRDGTDWGSDGVSPLYVSTGNSTKYALHVLFVGNSYTSVHNIPKQVADIASSDPGNATQFFVQSITRSGATLKEIWEEGKAADAIRSSRWDYVVIQEQSLWAVANVETSTEYFGRFAKLAHQFGAKTVLYLTWPRKPGSHWYTDGHTAFLRSPDSMLHKLIYQTYNIARITGASTADVGIYWWRASRDHPEIELYEADASHQSVAGSYLAALVFYKTLSRRDVTKATFLPAGISQTDGKTLRAVVSQPLPKDILKPSARVL
jgi:hypothetical protein